MKRVTLGGSGISVPQLGFGCASILGRNSRSESERALGVAWDEGVRFFDTARSYGYGESEGVLGGFLRGRREEAVIATKFGILPARQPAWKRAARSLARGVLRVAPGTHRLLQRKAASQFTPNQFTIPVLTESIEQSLRKLGTEYVDMLFLHAAPASVLEQDDLLEAMERLVMAGKVRMAGLSAEPAVIALALERQVGVLTAMQFPCNVFDVSASGGLIGSAADRVALVANHPFGGAGRVEQTRELIGRMAASEGIEPALREKLSRGDDALLADLVLNLILAGTGIHVVIPAMMKPEHIRLNAAAVRSSRFTAEELAWMRGALSGSVREG